MLRFNNWDEKPRRPLWAVMPFYIIFFSVTRNRIPRYGIRMNVTELDWRRRTSVCRRKTWRCYTNVNPGHDKVDVHPLFSIVGGTQECAHGTAARMNLLSSYLTVPVRNTQPPNMCKEGDDTRLGLLAGAEIKEKRTKINRRAPRTSILSSLWCSPAPPPPCKADGENIKYWFKMTRAFAPDWECSVYCAV